MRAILKPAMPRSAIKAGLRALLNGTRDWLVKEVDDWFKAAKTQSKEKVLFTVSAVTCPAGCAFGDASARTVRRVRLGCRYAPLAGVPLHGGTRHGQDGLLGQALPGAQGAGHRGPLHATRLDAHVQPETHDRVTGESN